MPREKVSVRLVAQRQPIFNLIQEDRCFSEHQSRLYARLKANGRPSLHEDIGRAKPLQTSGKSLF